MTIKDFFTILLESEIADKMQIYISRFSKSFEVIKRAIETKTPIKHNSLDIKIALKNISENITKPFYIKEKAHQNTTFEKEKYDELMSSIAKYNQLLNDYNNLFGGNNETIGDSFRQLGQNTTKKSVKTRKN